MKYKILIIAALLFSLNATAQKDVVLTIRHMLGSSGFNFNQAATNNLNNPFDVSRLEYHLSGFTIIHDGGQEIPVANIFVLAKGDNNVFANLGTYNVTNVEGIKFHVGIDSVTNATIEPSTANPPLDNQNPPMWWGWLSGYFYVIMNGSDLSASPSGDFELHALGNPNYFEQTVMAPGINTGNTVLINLDADYTRALEGIDMTLQPFDHGADLMDLKMLENFRDYVFSPGPGYPLAIKNIENNIRLNIYPNPSKGDVSLQVENNSPSAVTDINIYDVAGRLINQLAISGKNKTDLHFAQKGIYVVQLNSYGIPLATKKILIQ